MGIEEQGDFKWCRFCETRKHNKDFVKVYTRTGRRFVTWKCKTCSKAGKLSVAERDALEVRRADIRATEASAKLKEASRLRAEAIQKRQQQEFGE